MKNKIFQIWENCTFWPLSVEFISETIEDIGILLKYLITINAKNIEENIVVQKVFGIYNTV